MQSRWRLPLVLDAYPERSLETLGSSSDPFGALSPDDPLPWRVSHLKMASGDHCRGNNLEVGDRDELPDLQLAPADDGQSWGLDSSDADHCLGASPQDHGRRAGQ